MRLILFLLLPGCNVDWGFGGEETGPGLTVTTDQAPSLDASEETADDWDSGSSNGAVDTGCDSGEDTGGMLPVLQATGGDGTIAAVHWGIDGPCGIGWLVDARYAPPFAISATYTEEGASLVDACICDHAVRYTIENLPPGHWTLTAEGQTVEVDVY